MTAGTKTDARGAEVLALLDAYHRADDRITKARLEAMRERGDDEAARLRWRARREQLLALPLADPTLEDVERALRWTSGVTALREIVERHASDVERAVLA